MEGMESTQIDQQTLVVSPVNTDCESTKVIVCPRCDRRRERERGYAREARKRKKLLKAEEKEEGETED